MTLHIWNCSLWNASHHTSQLPAVGWVAATLVGMFSKSVSELCLILGGTNIWLNGLHSLVLIMLYGLITGLFCISESHESFIPTGHWKI